MADTYIQIYIQTVLARQMPPLTGLRIVARNTWFYNDAAPTELSGRAHEGDWRHRCPSPVRGGIVVETAARIHSRAPSGAVWCRMAKTHTQIYNPIPGRCRP